MALNLRQKSNWLFAQISLLGMALTMLFAGLFYKIYTFSLGALGNMALNRVQTACGCRVAASSGYSMFTGIILLLGLAIIATFIIAFTKIALTLIKTKKFIAAQKINSIDQSSKLKQVADTIGISHNIIEVHTARPVVFCHGLQQPKIYISSAVVQMLQYPELQAVLLHETHHMLSKEPVRLLCIKFISGFGFIPGIKNLIKKYLSFSEMAADELATDNFKEKNYLASAMAKILEMEEASIIQKELAVSYFSQITEERILALSDNNYKPTVTKEIIKTILGIVAAGFIFFLFSSSIKTQQAQAQEAYVASGCAGKISVETCDNAWTKCVDKIYHAEKIECKKTSPYIKVFKSG
jgi:beta-lactamase regulating signal transducer with metallopeptidase domain